MLLAGTVGCGSRGGSGATGGGSGIPDDWTHKELAEHLAKRGLKYNLCPTRTGSFFGPAAYLVPEGSFVAKDEESARAAYSAGSPDVVYVQLRTSQQDARDQTGLKGDRAFSSGRFLFQGEPKHLERIRGALP